MIRKAELDQARETLLGLAGEFLEKYGSPENGITENIDLEKAAGRILAFDLRAEENVPAFDRSPYDGYAFRSADTKGASEKSPVKLRIIEEIPAGKIPEMKITEGTAAKILTGAAIPQGADAVIMFEKTEFTDKEVTVFSESDPGDNIVKTGEDVKKGQLLAPKGSIIDPGLAGTLAAQGIARPLVYRRLKAALISTGSELVDAGDEVPDGKIRNTNRYTLAAALAKEGIDPVYTGTARDNVDEITALLEKGLSECDMVLATGGVSVGDYDLTPDAMEKVGCSILINGVNIKPGMACCFGERDHKPVFALSGNPSSSLINYQGVVLPAVRKMTGRIDYMPKEITVKLAAAFNKKAKVTRILKGTLGFEGGQAVMYVPEGQGNVMIGSSIGCDLAAVVPAGSKALEAGDTLKAMMV